MSENERIELLERALHQATRQRDHLLGDLSWEEATASNPIDPPLGNVQRTMTIAIYSFDELSDDAKRKARSWWIDGMDIDLDFVIDYAKSVGRLMGIEVATVPYSGFGSQGDGAVFTGRYRFTPGAEASVKGYFRENFSEENGCAKRLIGIARSLDELQSQNDSSLAADVTHGNRYCHEGTATIVVRRTDGEDVGDVAEEGLQETLRSFMRLIYSELEEAFLYQMSDESVDENIISNEYDFDVLGRRI